jgi:release factor glutamine methyltransferase
LSSVRELLSSASLPGDSGRLEAELLLSHCLGKPRSYLYAWPEAAVEAANADRFGELLRRRGAGEPVAYLVGSREFWSLELQVTESTLIPRPETETLVEWALELPLAEEARVADLGTGSGAIALALASERPGWRVDAIEKDLAALEVARHNAAALRLANVHCRAGSWCDGLADDYALLVSNPPYVAEGDPHLEAGDLRFEPVAALCAAEQGLADLRAIVAAAPGCLAPGGYLLLEHGFQQRDAVADLLSAAGFVEVSSRRDLGGRWRVTGGRRGAD